MKHFYTHLLKMESIFVELDKMDLSKEEKIHLAHLVEANLQHTILDAILSQLKDHDKRAFITHLNDRAHDKIWEFLNEKVENVEDRIKKVAEDLKIELHKDLKEARLVTRVERARSLK